MTKRILFVTAALLIAARTAQGFRRCGIHHPPEQVRHPPGTFDAAQVEALKAEPNLIVVEAEPTAEEIAALEEKGIGTDPKKKATGKTPAPAS